MGLSTHKPFLFVLEYIRQSQAERIVPLQGLVVRSRLNFIVYHAVKYRGCNDLGNPYRQRSLPFDVVVLFVVG